MQKCTKKSKYVHLLLSEVITAILSGFSSLYIIRMVIGNDDAWDPYALIKTPKASS